MTVGCSRLHGVVQWWSVAARLAVTDIKLEVDYVLRLMSSRMSQVKKIIAVRHWAVSKCIKSKFQK